MFKTFPIPPFSFFLFFFPPQPPEPSYQDLFVAMTPIFVPFWPPWLTFYFFISSNFQFSKKFSFFPYFKSENIIKWPSVLWWRHQIILFFTSFLLWLLLLVIEIEKKKVSFSFQIFQKFFFFQIPISRQKNLEKRRKKKKRIRIKNKS